MLADLLEGVNDQLDAAERSFNRIAVAVRTAAENDRTTATTAATTTVATIAATTTVAAIVVPSNTFEKYLKDNKN